MIVQCRRNEFVEPGTVFCVARKKCFIRILITADNRVLRLVFLTPAGEVFTRQMRNLSDTTNEFLSGIPETIMNKAAVPACFKRYNGFLFIFYNVLMPRALRIELIRIKSTSMGATYLIIIT